MAQTSDGGYIFAGYSRSSNYDVPGNKGGDDYWIVKIDSTGAIQWKKTYGGAADDDPFSILQTSDGGYIVAGYTSSVNTGDVTGYHGGAFDGWILKLDSNGNLQWTKTLGGSGTDPVFSIVQTPDGGYAATGQSTSNNGDVSGNHGLHDYWLVKLNSTGTIQWQKSYGGSNYDLPIQLIITTDGGFLLVGKSQSNNADVTGNHGGYDTWVVKADNTGAVQWQKSLGGSNEDGATMVLQSADGGYVIAGYTKSTDKDVSGLHGDRDFWLVNIDNSGSLQWQKTYGGNGDDMPRTLKATNDGGYIMAGYTTSTNGDITSSYGAQDLWVVKLTPALSLLVTDINNISAVNAGESNIITWNTTTEDEGDYFMLQRSNDGKSFHDIYSTQGKGNQSDYQYTDRTPGAGTNYYRLFIMKKSGKNFYSNVVKVLTRKQNNTTINLYPIPACNSLSVSTSLAVKPNTTMQIADMTGKVLRVIKVTSTQTVIDISNLPASTYFLLYDDAGNRSAKKFMVVK